MGRSMECPGYLRCHSEYLTQTLTVFNGLKCSTNLLLSPFAAVPWYVTFKDDLAPILICCMVEAWWEALVGKSTFIIIILFDFEPTCCWVDHCDTP